MKVVLNSNTTKAIMIKGNDYVDKTWMEIEKLSTNKEYELIKEQ